MEVRRTRCRAFTPVLIATLELASPAALSDHLQCISQGSCAVPCP
jgi:hypothetical protein